MDDLETLLKSDLSDAETFQRAVEGVQAAQTAAEAQVAAMVGAWVPGTAATLDAACEAQEHCAAQCARAGELLEALEAVDAAAAEARTQAEALDSPLTRVAALAAEPFLQDVVKDALGTEVPAFVTRVTAVLDDVWRAPQSSATATARAQTVAQCTAVFASVVYASCASDSLACAQILLDQASALAHVARHVARLAAGVRGTGDDAWGARAALGGAVAALERAAAQARARELALRQAEAHALLEGDGGGLDRTIHNERRAAVKTAFWRLRNTLQTTVDRWAAAAPHAGRVLGMALCAAVAEDVVQHLLALTVIREQECHYLHDAIRDIVGVRDECFGKSCGEGKEEKEGVDKGTAAAELERCWARMCALYDALEMNMAQLEQAWPAFSRVLTNAEINTFVCAAYGDCPKRTQLLSAIAAIPATAVPTDFQTPLLM